MMVEHTKTPKKIKEEEEFTPGLIPDEEEPTGRKQLLSKYTPLIMPALMALAITFFLVNIMAVSKGTYNNAVGGLSIRMAAIEASIGDEGTGQGAIVTELEILKGQLANVTSNTVDQEQLNNLAIKIANLEAQVDVMELIVPTSLTNEIADRFAQLDAIVEDIEDDIAALQVERDEEPVVIDDITVWTKEIYSSDPNIQITYTISPYKVEDGGDYIIMVYLSNTELITKSDIVLDIIFSPKTGDRVKVDEDEIYLDSTRSPFYSWFGEVVKRSDDTVRRMVFASERIAVPAAVEIPQQEGSIIDPGRLTLRLEFTLAYK